MEQVLRGGPIRAAVHRMPGLFGTLKDNSSTYNKLSEVCRIDIASEFTQPCKVMAALGIRASNSSFLHR